MHEQKKLQALFFDFDGVIVDSCTIKENAFLKIFAGFSSEIIDRILEYHRLHGGISRVEKIRWAHAELIKKPLSEKDLDLWANHYSSLVVDAVVKAPYIAGAREFLEYCRVKKNELPLFVVSGTPQPELQEIVTRRGLDKYFTRILGSPVGKPEHIDNLLKQYRLSPGRCLFIGDAITDYNAALATGLHFIGIRGAVAFPEGVTVLSDCRNLKEMLAGCEMF